MQDFVKKHAMSSRLMWVLLLSIALFPCTGTAQIMIPYTETITVDGDSSDWFSQIEAREDPSGFGYRIEVMTDENGSVRPVEDFDVRCRLAWNTDGMLLLVIVSDDVNVEHNDLMRIWCEDSFQILMSEGVGVYHWYRIVIAPGLSTAFPEPRNFVDDRRRSDEENRVLGMDLERTALEGGYLLEVMLPWSNLGITPERGTSFALQLIAGDSDDYTNSDDDIRVGWYPAIAPNDPRSMYMVVLGDEPSYHRLWRVNRRGTRDGFEVEVVAARELTGRSVEVTANGQAISQGVLQAVQGRAGVVLNLPSPEEDNWPAMTVVVDGHRSTQYSASPGLGQVFQRYHEALGGVDALAALRTVSLRGRWVDSLSWTDPPMAENTIELQAEHRDRYRLRESDEDNVHLSGCMGNSAWKQDEQGLRAITPDEMIGVYWIFNPVAVRNIENIFSDFQYVGQITDRGQQVIAVDAITHDGETRRMHFDPETGLLTRYWYFNIAEYDERNGIQYPVQLYCNRKGGWTRMFVDSVEFGGEMDDELFREP